MSLLSHEVLDDVRELITEITKFQEDDENFTICERYCISHVMHHTYPSVSRSSVKNMITSYVSRFYSHGYFKVSEELDNQIKIFLSNEELFEKNPEYDIQWSLLSLLFSLSSNLTSVKEVPTLLPVDEEEEKPEDFDWKEYLTKDIFPRYSLEELTSSSEENSEEEHNENSDGVTEKSHQETEQTLQEKENIEILYDNIKAFQSQVSLENQKKLIEEFVKRKKSKSDLEHDFKVRGNITKKIEKVLSEEGIVRNTQYVTEFELMENILHQLQSGEKIFLRKGLLNPALTSVTQDTLCDYLNSLEPYFIIIRSLKDFDDDVTKARYPEESLHKSSIFSKNFRSSPNLNRENDLSRRNISNVLYIYNFMLKKALQPFHNELTNIVENLDSYTILKMEKKLRPYYFFLASLFSVHKDATKGWEYSSNWMCSVRILSVLHNAFTNSASTKMSLLYLNLFLHCFQVYLNIIDAWISFVELKDPNDDFIVTKSDKTESGCSLYEVRPYETEVQKSGIKPVPLISSIAERMVHVGQSLEVLRQLNRFVPSNISKETSFQILIRTIQEKLTAFAKLIPSGGKKPQEKEVKQKGIFTIKNTNFGIQRKGAGGGGDSIEMEIFFKEILKEEEKNKSKEKPKEEVKKEESSYREFMYSMIGNPFFKASFDDLGVRQVQKKLEEARQRKGEESGDNELLLVKIPEEGEKGLYPLHKIVFEAFHEVVENRVFSARALVKDIVLKECNLPAHLSLIRSLLLFNCSYLIQSFILTFFTQPATWNSSYSLTLHLKDCLRALYKDLVNALTVTSAKSSLKKCENILQVIDVITVNYEVQWPLTLVFTSDVMRKYNEIFRLALKLKWAHWVLCRQHFHRVTSVCHKLQLLKFWFLSDLGRLNNYFMAQMVPHDLEYDSFVDFKDIIQGHLALVNEVHKNCLLGDESSEKRKLIVEDLLPLCMELSQAKSDISETKLSEIEKAFGICHNKLSCLMQSLEK